MKNFSLKPKGHLPNAYQLFILLLFLFQFNLSQAQSFDKRYGLVSNNHDAEQWEMLTCHAVVNANYDYVGIYAKTGVNSEKMIGVRIHDNGQSEKNVFRNLYHLNDSFDFRPLKIIPLISDSGYAVTGHVFYHWNRALGPFPFVMLLDTALAITDFKRFNFNGLFSDIEQLSNRCFLFCGSKTDDVNTYAVTTPRKGVMVKTTLGFTPLWMREITLFSGSPSSMQYFDIIHDAVIIHNDSAIICGSVTEQCGVLIEGKSRVLLANVNLTNGTFYWHRTHFNNNKLASHLAINSTEIVMAVNSGNVGGSLLAFYDRGGNFVDARSIRFQDITPGMVINNGGGQVSTPLKTRLPYIQNIYHRSDGTIFMSGKFLFLFYKAATYADIPFSAVYDNVSHTYPTAYLYRTRHKYPFIDILTYTNHLNASVCSSDSFPPFVAYSNTVPRVSGTDEFVTMTHDWTKTLAPPPFNYWTFKILCYTNATMCSKTDLTAATAATINPVNHTNVTNTNVSNPDIIDCLEVIDDQSWTRFNCEY